MSQKEKILLISIVKWYEWHDTIKWKQKIILCQMNKKYSTMSSKCKLEQESKQLESSLTSKTWKKKQQKEIVWYLEIILLSVIPQFSLLFSDQELTFTPLNTQYLISSSILIMKIEKLQISQKKIKLQFRCFVFLHFSYACAVFN